MKIDSDTMISIYEANQNFSKVARLVDKHGSAVILKNNVPKYLVIEFCQAEALQTAASDGEVMEISDRLMKRNKKVYEKLAK